MIRDADKSKAGETGKSGPRSNTIRVHDILQRMIITGEIPPGERIKVEDLKTVLGVGASPIREALSLLTSARLVDRVDQRGFRAAKVSGVRYQELLKTRCWLEERAIRESIAEGGTAWEEELVLAHHRLVKTPRVQTGMIADDRYEDRHKQFHMALIAACGSSILLTFCDQLYDQNIRYRHIAGRTRGYASRDVTSEHEAITGAALDRNADEAARLLIAHYQQTGRFLSDQL